MEELIRYYERNPRGETNKTIENHKKIKKGFIEYVMDREDLSPQELHNKWKKMMKQN